MKKLKIFFTDFWINFSFEENLIYRTLIKKYDVVIDQYPEYLFYSAYGFEHVKYNCIKIFYTGENLVPDFNLCDYAIGFHFINFEDRYLRIPLCFTRESYKSVIHKTVDFKNVLNRKFCNFVYSNSNYADPFRLLFFEKLSEYKKVDSGGSLQNNIGGRVKDKIQFLADYKFTIAFENSEVNGYTTEKIVEPMSVNSIPIYWGNPKIGVDFNLDSFILVKDKSIDEINKSIEKIKFLDNHDDEYLKLLSLPWINHDQYYQYEPVLSEFLDYIITQPYLKAKRRAEYGSNKVYTEKLGSLTEAVKNCKHQQKKHVIILKKIIKKILKVLYVR
jgi:hypothetical protein